MIETPDEKEGTDGADNLLTFVDHACNRAFSVWADKIRTATQQEGPGYLRRLGRWTFPAQYVIFDWLHSVVIVGIIEDDEEIIICLNTQ